MIASERVTWLAERTELGILSGEILQEIAEVLETRTFAGNENLTKENTPLEALYILEAGQLERQCTTQPCCLLPGSAVNLQEFLLDSHSGYTVTALSESQVWAIAADRFRQILEKYPEIARVYQQRLAENLDRVSAQLAYERERQEQLRPYLVPKARRGVIGSSRYAVRLRQQIRKAAQDRDSVTIFGEPGLEKDNIAALMHYGSQWRREPMIQLTSGLLQTSGAELFGRAGGKPGAIEWVGTGTIVLNNVHDLPEELCPKVAQLLETGTYTPVTRDPDTPAEPRPCRAQIILIAEQRMPQFDRFVTHQIKVPPLRVRKADIKAQADYLISLYCRTRGLAKPTITPKALRSLQAYDFPNNLRELDDLVKRAIVQGDGASVLTKELFWSIGTPKNRFRVNLLQSYPQFRRFLRSPLWPDRINYGFTSWFFALIVGILFLGPQTRDANIALNLFWAWWWPLVLLGFPFVGRLWCAICPFMIYGEITQKLSRRFSWGPLKNWPRQEADRWGGWFLFGLFTLIFLWEELWHLENTAYLSSCLLLLITAGAVIFSAIFERRFWCRYLCPIGGMNGLFAKLSMTELRAQKGICSAECSTYQCYKGGPQKGEGQETLGCPLYSHPAQLEDNRDCVLCMTCLKACPHRSVQFNLRPPAMELWTTHVPRAYEVALLGLLLGGIFLHRLPEIDAILGLNIDLTQFWPHLGFSVAALVLPSIVPLLAYGAIALYPRTAQIPQPRSFLGLAYGFLPLVWGGSLAHYLDLGLTEAGRIVPVTVATFGFPAEGLPVWVAHPAVIAFLQGTTIAFSVLLSVVLTQKIARRSFRFLFPQHLGTLALGIGLWLIIVGGS
ncbi:MAG: sigma 54-interacting transcriptional regulator [Cyanobacteriota bacterium]|nr:sigma 54-interacting transcriptional regulator [Cyanobacteriota bacterium]